MGIKQSWWCFPYDKHILYKLTKLRQKFVILFMIRALFRLCLLIMSFFQGLLLFLWELLKFVSDCLSKAFVKHCTEPHSATSCVIYCKGESGHFHFLFHAPHWEAAMITAWSFEDTCKQARTGYQDVWEFSRWVSLLRAGLFFPTHALYSIGNFSVSVMACTICKSR